MNLYRLIEFEMSNIVRIESLSLLTFAFGLLI